MDGYAGGSGFASRLRPLGYAVPRLEGLEAPAQTQAHADQAGRSTGRSEEGFTLPQGLLEFRACDKTGREANRTMSQNSLVRLALFRAAGDKTGHPRSVVIRTTTHIWRIKESPP